MSGPGSNDRQQRPLIAHVIFRLDYGGLENGVVNLVNSLPADAFRHAIIAMTEVGDFCGRIKRADVATYALDKQPGKDPAAYWRLYRLLRRIQPTILHTRNLGTLECALVGRLAGVSVRIHGEHGWDTHDPDGNNEKYRRLRRMINPAITSFVTVSRELERWLSERVGIDQHKVVRICNGVDVERFRPGSDARGLLPPHCREPGCVVVGSVTRFSEIKDPLNLVRAFIEARKAPDGGVLRLVMPGDGPVRSMALELLAQSGNMGAAWLPGSREDIPELMRAMDIFVLGSRREGVSNTVLEAMASGLPVVASAVGGNLELIEEHATGVLVPPGDSSGLANALGTYLRAPGLRRQHGARARVRVEREYSLSRMLREYERLYRTHVLAVEEAA